MKSTDLKKALREGAFEKYSALYNDIDAQTERFIKAIEAFEVRFGSDRDVMILSVPGRSEICGNHTDHNLGRVLAGAINRDVIAVASPNSEKKICILSEGFGEDEVCIDDIADKSNFESYSSRSIIGGMAYAISEKGYSVGGFDAYTTTEVLKGSGLSSSAAFEVLVGSIINHLYAGGKINNKDIAIIAQYAENEYFGKPCGLMDQMACAVGGFVYIDFKDPKKPEVISIEPTIKESGFSLCIINTGGNHADLNEDYASIPREMKAVARELGRDALRGLSEDEIIAAIPALRGTVGDRAILRSLHFVRENDRVTVARDALASCDIQRFFRILKESGRSSFEYLQNVYTNTNVKEQGLSLALAVADGYLGDIGAYRVHGGGFAGTVQVFLPSGVLKDFCSAMDAIFGEGAAMPLDIRPAGAIRLF